MAKVRREMNWLDEKKVENIILTRKTKDGKRDISNLLVFFAQLDREHEK